MPTVEVLGIAQDAGVPHLGCDCSSCVQARTADGKPRYASAIVLHDDGTFLFDATPDIRFQLPKIPDSVFLTHAHLGHLSGVLFFGVEAADTDRIPVYATDGLGTVIRENAPLNLLLEQDNLQINTISDGSDIELNNATVTAYRVPHRESLETGTLGYVIEGPVRSLLYLTDIDEWTAPTRELVEQVDIALVDGTFWNTEELNRSDDVPHPYIEDSVEILDSKKTDIYFTHLNHTNPVLDTESQQLEQLSNAGFHIAEQGATFGL
jgi:pyrroloquinoline quinone biosynthesis protein B